MCQRGLRREPCNEALLLLLLAGVLLLFSPSPPGSSVLPGCDARLLPLDAERLGHGGAGGEERRGEGNSLRRLLADNDSVPSPLRAAAAVAPTTGNETVVEQRESSESNSSLLWAFLVGPTIFLLLVATAVTAKVRLVIRKRRREAGTVWKKGLSFHDHEQLEKYTFADIPTITFEELEAACEEFTNVIGTATDCAIFKGIRASDGLPIAVTRMKIPPERWTARREIGFRHKVEDLARMNHSSMVNLLAYCATDTPFERILVFEYASNGTLYEHLHAKGVAEDHLDWPTRMRIVMGAASGLEYLHHTLVPPTSHFRFDARHVFLTEDYAAKLADFAVSADSSEFSVKTLGRRKSFAKIATAVGYSEWEARKHTSNIERNVRSFGVFLLEVVTGRRPFTDTQGPLIEWAKEYLNDSEKMWLMVDPSLKDYKKSELKAICDAAKMCIRPKGNKLPTMNELADMLSKALGVTREAANRKLSPLLWAELELLASMEHSVDDMAPLGSNSPKNLSVDSPGSRKFSHQVSVNSPRGFLPSGTTNKNFNPNGSSKNEHEMTSISPSAPPRLLISHSSTVKRSWGASDVSEMELLSPPDDVNESQETPLAASINSCIPSSQGPVHEGFGRSLRRIWSENSTEMAKLEGRSVRSDDLSR